VGEVEVEHRPGGRAVPAWPLSSVAGGEVEGQLAAGQLTGRDRTAYVQGLGGAEVAQLGGGVSDLLCKGSVLLRGT
jgi:hypothetical protein